jgi:Tfp pilus assembly protein PilX
MASPTNWLIFELVVVAVVGVIALFVARAANQQSKLTGINGR